MGLRNKARLTTGEIVEYDEAIKVDPANPETPKPVGNYETKYLGVGEIVEAGGCAVNNGDRVYHLWEYLDTPETRAMAPEQLLRLMDSAPDEDGYRRSTEFQPAPKTRLFPWNPPQIFREYKTH